jgi:basic amino acid/polyamine antiporter, APA family
MSRAAGLKRILGVGFGFAVIVGATLGVGILRTPGLVAAQLDSAGSVLLVWLAGGLYTLVGSICLTELGTMLPQAGGYYVYARRAFGDTVGFAVGWSDWITYGSILGYVTIAIGEFAAVLLPALLPWVKVVAISVAVGFGALQWAGLRISSRFQEATTAVKFLAFLALVAACFLYGRTQAETPPPIGRSAASGLVGWIVALQSVAVTYGGWQSALYFTEEDRDPRRNLPRSMIGGVSAVIVVYLLVNLALLAVLPLRDLASSTLPAADAAALLFGARGGQLITLLSLVSLLPLINAVLMIGTRILFAMSRDGLVWRGSASVNERGTPVIATVLTVAVAASLIATGTFQRLVAVTAFFLAVNYCVSCAALVALRHREPGWERPFRAWGYPWSAAVVLLGAVSFLIGAVLGDAMNALIATGLLGTGMLGWEWAARRREHLDALMRQRRSDAH